MNRSRGRIDYDDWRTREQIRIMAQWEENVERLHVFLSEIMIDFLRRLSIMHKSWKITTLRGVKANLTKGIRNVPRRLLWSSNDPEVIELEQNVLSFEVDPKVAALFPGGLILPAMMML